MCFVLLLFSCTYIIVINLESFSGEMRMLYDYKIETDYKIFCGAGGWSSGYCVHYGHVHV